MTEEVTTILPYLKDFGLPILGALIGFGGSAYGQWLAHNNNKDLKKIELSISKVETAYSNMQALSFAIATHSGLVEELVTRESNDIKDLVIELGRYEESIWTYLSPLDAYVFLHADELIDDWMEISSVYKEYFFGASDMKLLKAKGDQLIDASDLPSELLTDKLADFTNALREKHKALKNAL